MSETTWRNCFVLDNVEIRETIEEYGDCTQQRQYLIDGENFVVTVTYDDGSEEMIYAYNGEVYVDGVIEPNATPAAYKAMLTEHITSWSLRYAFFTKTGENTYQYEDSENTVLIVVIENGKVSSINIETTDGSYSYYAEFTWGNVTFS